MTASLHGHCMPCFVDPSTCSPEFLVSVEAISVGNLKVPRAIQ